MNVSAGTNVDLLDSTNFDLRINGVGDTDVLGYAGLQIADINNNGKPDLIIAAPRTDYNTWVNSGSIYIIYDDIHTVTSPGTELNLSDPNNWNVRIDGDENPTNGNFRGLGWGSLQVADINGDTKLDIIAGEGGTAYSGANAGSVFIIDNDKINSYSGTGNTFHLGDSANYSIRIDGGAANEELPAGVDTISAGDFIGGSGTDLVLGTYLADYNSRANSGSVYIIGEAVLAANYPGTGDVISLATSTNYNLRIDGAVGGDNFGRSLVKGDIDNDNEIDLMVSAKQTDYTGGQAGSVYIFFNTLLKSFVGTGNTADLSVTSNFNVRYDGANGGDNLGYGAISNGDFNGNNSTDLLLNADLTDHNSRGNSGSLYIIYDDLVPNSGTGNIVLLSDTSNYHVRIDGAVAGDGLGFASTYVGDYDYDNYDDIIVHALAGNNSRSASGSVYLVNNDIFSGLMGTGNTLDIADSNNYSYRIDGAVTSDQLGYHGIRFDDLNGDGIEDMMIPALGGDPNGVNAAGYVYIIYGGSVVDNLITDLNVRLLNNLNIDPSSNLQFGDNTVVVGNNGIISGEVDVDFEFIGELDWSGVISLSDVANGKGLINGLEGAPGVISTPVLYIPIPSGYSSDQILVCPDVSTIDQIVENCSGGEIIQEGDSRISLVTIDGQQYWRVTEVGDAGGMAYLQALADTGDAYLVTILTGLTILSVATIFKKNYHL